MMASQTRQAAAPLKLAKAVFWSFLGIRKRSDYEADSTQLKPQHVIIAGLVGALFLVLGLILLVRLVLGNLV